MIWLNRNKFFNKHLPMLLSVILLATGIGAYFVIKQSQPAQSAWYTSSGGTWNYRQSIVIDHNKVSTATGTTTPLSNFPVLISTTNALFKSVNNGGHVALDTGNDIVFTSGDQLTKLPHEIETYASTTGQLVAWVNVPSLSSVTDTTLYMYYGNSAETGNEQNPTAVWDTNYKGVWHLPNGTSLTSPTHDSTNNGFNGTFVNAPTAVVGQIDGGANFVAASNQYIQMGNNLNIGGTDFTIEGWINAPNVNQVEFVIGKRATGSFQQYELGIGSINSGGSGVSGKQIYVLVYDGGGFNNSHVQSYHTTANVIDGNWHHVVATRTTGIIAIYIDGVSMGLTADLANSTSINPTSGSNFTLGGGDVSFLPYNGKLDEARVSTTFARSADWIKTEYLNQNSPTTFAVFQGEGTPPRAANKGSVAIVNRGSGLAWFNSGGTWTNRRQIIINHNFVGSTATTTFSNFPFLFSSLDNELKFTGSGGKVASSTGGDILFTAADGVTKLDEEIESYTPATGQLVAWVRIPLLSATTDTVIYIYYGNASSGNQQNPTGVWDANYKGVWHLPNGTSLTANDSTGVNNGTLVNTPTAVAGQIDGSMGLAAASSQYANVGTITISGSQITTSAWVNMTTFPATGKLMVILSDAYSGGVENVGHYFDLYNNAGTVQLRSGTYRSAVTTEANWSIAGWATGSWHYIVGLYNGSAWQIYFDGVQKVSTNGATGANNNLTSLIGAEFTNGPALRFLDGKMDEVRLSNTARTPDWIKTEYNNQFSPQTFYVLTGASNSQARPANVPLIKARGGVKFH